MPKKIIVFFIGFLMIFIIVSNLTFLRYFLPQTYPHKFCADQCKFWTYERATGHNTLGSVEMEFERYKKETKQPMLILHRRFYRHWWQIWNWYDFLASPRWDYPYAEKDEDS
jgi:hypothetical protein